MEPRTAYVAMHARILECSESDAVDRVWVQPGVEQALHVSGVALKARLAHRLHRADLLVVLILGGP